MGERGSTESDNFCVIESAFRLEICCKTTNHITPGNINLMYCAACTSHDEVINHK